MRTPAPWFRKQTKSWYVKINGTQHPLGKDEKAAKKKYHRLMAAEGWTPPVKEVVFADLVEHFLEDAAKLVTPETLAWYKIFLDDFCERFPKLKAKDIAPRHVNEWLTQERDRPWGDSTRRSAITILKRCLNWGVKNRLLTENPIQHHERPAATRRERVLTDEEKRTILSWYPEGDVFRDFLVAMMESGARPGEVAKVEAKDVDVKEGTWTIHGKSTKRTGRKRVIYLTPTLLSLTKRLGKQHPSGPLFRNEDGKPWTRQAINCRFRRKRSRKKEPLGADITAYVYRATWATEALENGVPDATVAELMGHSGTVILHKHYSSLREKREHLRRAAEQAVKK